MLLAAWLASAAARVAAQESTPGAPADGTPAPAPAASAPATGTTTPGGASSFGSPASSFGTPASSFGAPTSTFAAPELPAGPSMPGIPGSAPGGAGNAAPNGSVAGAASLSSGNSGTAVSQLPSSFSVPGGYGLAPQNFTAGEGRLARPHFEYSGSLSFGYDDNTFSTPFNALGQKEVRERVLVQAARDAFTVEVPIALPRGGGPGQARPVATVTVPGQKAIYKDVVVSPAVAPAEPEGSFLSRANLTYGVQFATRRTVFTMDLLGNATYYPNRSRDPIEYNGSLALVYLHRITPRLQFSASANLAYLSQPDLSRVNAPTAQTGQYFNANSKYDLTYRWSPRFSTVTTLSLNSQLFIEKTEESGNFYEVLIGTEGRWLMTPRLTLLGEFRYGRSIYETNASIDSSSLYLLAGGEVTLSRKLSASVRAGEEVRTFEESGITRASPYVETNVAFRYSRTGVVTWNTRVGFEAPSSANGSNQVFRSSLNVAQAFSVRTRGTLGFAAVHRIITDTTTDDTVSDNNFEADLGLAYTVNKHTTLTANYTFLTDLSTTAGSSYLRNQIFLGLQYSF